MKIHISRESVEHILLRHAAGTPPGKIAHEVKVKRNAVERILQRQRRHEAIMSAVVIGKDAQTRIGRAASEPPMLAEHRNAKGRIDWDSVRGYVDVREEVKAIMSGAAPIVASFVPGVSSLDKRSDAHWAELAEAKAEKRSAAKAALTG